MDRVNKLEQKENIVVVKYENNDTEVFHIISEKLEYDDLEEDLKLVTYKEKYIDYNIFVEILNKKANEYSVNFEKCFIDIENNSKPSFIYNIQNMKFQRCKINNYDFGSPIRFFNNFMFERCESNCSVNINYLLPSTDINCKKKIHISNCEFESMDLYYCQINFPKEMFNEETYPQLIYPNFSLQISDDTLINKELLIHNNIFTNMEIRDTEILGDTKIFTNILIKNMYIKNAYVKCNLFLIISNIIKQKLLINECRFQVDKFPIVFNLINNEINLSSNHLNDSLLKIKNILNIEVNNDIEYFHNFIIEQTIDEFISLFRNINDELNNKYDINQITLYLKSILIKNNNYTIRKLFIRYFQEIDIEIQDISSNCKDLSEDDKQYIKKISQDMVEYLLLIVEQSKESRYCDLIIRNSNLNNCILKINNNNISSLDLYESIINEISSINYKELKTIILNKKEKDNVNQEKKEKDKINREISKEFLILSNAYHKNSDDRNANRFKYLSKKYKYRNWFFDLTTGYGVYPSRLFCVMILIMGISSYFYYQYGIASGNEEQKIYLWHSIYFSVVTFSTLGFGDFHPDNEISSAVAAIEGISGAFLIVLFISLVLKRYSDYK